MRGLHREWCHGLHSAGWLLHHITGSSEVSFDADYSRLPQLLAVMQQGLPDAIGWSYAQHASGVEALGIARTKKLRQKAVKLALGLACCVASSRALAKPV